MLLHYTAMASSFPDHGDANPSSSQQHLQGRRPLAGNSNNDPSPYVGRANPPNDGGIGGWPLTSSTISSSPYQMVTSRQQTAAQLPILNFVASLNPLMPSLSCVGVGSNNPFFASKPVGNDHQETAAPTPRTQLPAADPNNKGCNGTADGGNKSSIPCRIAPCRARGMPKDHNNKTAYFAIPHNIAHGEGLRCSHKDCHEKGIRFRYCSVCAVPVAKRNFSTRHLHGDLLEKSIREENGLVVKRSEADEVLAKRREVISNEKKGKRKVTSSSSAADTSCSEESSISSSFSSSSEESGKEDSSKHSKPLKKRRRKEGGRTGDSNGSDLETSSKRYHREWMKLLTRRPREGEALDAWLNEVMALSEKMSSNPVLRAQVEDLHASIDNESPI